MSSLSPVNITSLADVDKWLLGQSTPSKSDGAFGTETFGP